MTGAGWSYVEAAAGMLAPLEREAVLGDLAESDRGAWSGLKDVLGLAARRHLELWTSWRPWAASFGLALPASLFLMGCSLAASQGVAGLLSGPVPAPFLAASLAGVGQRALLWEPSHGGRFGRALWRAVFPVYFACRSGRGIEFPDSGCCYFWLRVFGAWPAADRRYGWS
jgi:hypothetical protein